MSSAFHNTPLAQDLASEIENGACKHQGVWWSSRESAHASALTTEEATAAAEPALELCRHCEEYDKCEIRAQLDNYTGLAAGAAYLNGVRHDPAKVRQKPSPPKTAA